MTEFELEILLTETGLAAVESFGMYVTVTVGYLVAAFVTGRKLTKTQVLIVNALFIISAMMMMVATVGFITRGIPIADALEVIHPDRLYAMQPQVRIAVVILESSGILASLKFMWDVRHSEAQ
jgi:hypothetical protein